MPAASRDEFEDAAGFGWSVPEARFDWPTLIAQQGRRDRAAREASTAPNLVSGRGRDPATAARVIEDAHTVRIVQTGDAQFAARTILVATGARPTLEPPIPGGELAITSNEVFHLEAPAGAHPDRRRRLHRRRVRRHLQRPRRRDDAAATAATSILRGFDEDVRATPRPKPMPARHRPDAASRTVDTARAPRRRDRGDALRRRRARRRRGAVRDRPPAEHRRPRPRDRRRRGSTAHGAIVVDGYSRTLDALDLRRRRRDRTAST